MAGAGVAFASTAGSAQEENMGTTDGTVDSFPIPQVNLKKIPPEFRRQTVEYLGHEWPGTVVVDTKNRFLFKILPGQQAIRYGIGVGREGFTWSGEAVVGAKQMWPTWNPPKEMVARDPNAAKWANGQPGGPDNPLGARALYLYQNGKDTLFRIHGTNAPKSIGKAMSSGCIRMLNQDVVEVYRMTPIGTRVTVLPADPQEIFEEDEIAGAGTPDIYQQ
ncbi:L,D-transpeptidase [Taklimakanibacter deserti]|uniref:L,D-transpeptidase n=1 Tax=Taklimakanibacter deserti TaxID=2267839 RepID=UPI000E65471C